MQGVGNDMDGVLVLGATNVPWELDNAIRRRFEKRIYISLPDEAARTGIFKIRTGKTKHELTDDDFGQLGKDSEGYSGSDIAVVVKEALMMPVRRCQTSKHFKQTPEGNFTPTYPSDPQALQKTLMDIPPEKLVCPAITYSDFAQALQRIKPSVCDADINEHVKWTSEFG